MRAIRWRRLAGPALCRAPTGAPREPHGKSSAGSSRFRAFGAASAAWRFRPARGPRVYTARPLRRLGRACRSPTSGAAGSRSPEPWTARAQRPKSRSAAEPESLPAPSRSCGGSGSRGRARRRRRRGEGGRALPRGRDWSAACTQGGGRRRRRRLGARPGSEPRKNPIRVRGRWFPASPGPTGGQ